MLLKSAESVPEIATLYVFSLAHSNGSPQLTVGVGLDRKVAKEREQLIVQTLWTAVAPSLRTQDPRLYSYDWADYSCGERG